MLNNKNREFYLEHEYEYDYGVVYFNTRSKYLGRHMR